MVVADEDINVGVEIFENPEDAAGFGLEDGETEEEDEGDRWCLDFEDLSNETNEDKRVELRSFEERFEDL